MPESATVKFSAAQLGQFRRGLLGWFGTQKRDLPWRRTRDAYAIWLSEIMLQQTRVAAAVPYFEKFHARFPTVQRLADAPVDEVLHAWAGLGYYSRARNLQRAAQSIVVHHNGMFPQQHSDALALPGVGPYTAAAVLSIAYHQPLAVLDGNVARVLARLTAMRGDLRRPSRWRTLQHHADLLLAPRAAGDWNQAMMELGATVCTPRAPKCGACPIATWCMARRRKLTESVPCKRNKRALMRVAIAAAVLLDSQGRTLLIKTNAKRARLSEGRSVETGIAKISQAETVDASQMPALFSHMWRFPSVAVRRNAHAELAQYLREVLKVNANMKEFEPLAHARHAVTFRQIILRPFLLRVKSLPRVCYSMRPLLTELSRIPISNATRKIARSAQMHLNDSLKNGPTPM